MPELPEVETIARGLRPALCGRGIQSVKVLHEKTLEGEWAKKTLFEHMVTGQHIEKVSRRGKLLLLYFSHTNAQKSTTGQNPIGVAFHLKMTGRLFIYNKDAQPTKHTRIVFELDDGNQLFFDDARTFGYARLFSKQSLPLWDFWCQLGPEPLEMTAQDFVYRMQGRRTIKALLLDQHAIAGIGNIYADEALFSAGIRPDAKAEHIPQEKLEALHGALQAVLHQSIAECGSSIRDYRDAHGNAGAFQNLFRVYGRSGQDCMHCKRLLTTAKIAGRTTVFCEHCQH